ncbi:GDSL-type esterase/lipase family protein [Microbacterium sp. 2MCAF23]|uniref:SGNH/GDSL hydrolase family protein n=1 Tax=Microbacterium sp. 2MCAF23 TaxID=3232985 RepID=UPI003F9552C4
MRDIIVDLGSLGIAPIDVREVCGERVHLPAGAPDRWLHGWHLRGVVSDFRGSDDTPVPGALVRGTVRLEVGGRRLDEGTDYLIDDTWGALTRVGDWSGDAAATYRVALRRVDAVIDRGDGAFEVIPGVPHLSNPLPPHAAGLRHVANVYVSAAGVELLPLREEPGVVRSSPRPDLFPAVARVRADGERPLRITCWGDSVTVGASSSSPWSSYPQLVSYGLASAGRPAEVTVVAVGGTTSAQWLDPGRLDLPFSAVVDSNPDLLIVEFVNDAEGDLTTWERSYAEIRERAVRMGADLLLMTPHFVMPPWMGHERLDEPDRRPYVAFLRAFCATHELPLADAARAWEALFAEGTAYPTLLRNGINHPDDRGHAIYAREALAAMGAIMPLEPRPVVVTPGWMAD